MNARMNRRFSSRSAAGLALAERVWEACPEPAVVAAIPRGGVAVAVPVAERLGAALGIVLVHKITVPAAPELAIGAVDEDGHTLLSADTVGDLHAGSSEVVRARERALVEIERQRALYPAPQITGFLPERTLVIVDDGLATGLTARAAVVYARRHGALRVIVAAPCASRDAAHLLESQADQLICPVIDDEFFAVAEYYDDFAPARDADVVRLLEQAALGTRERGSVG